ncbi:MAG: chemotaxis protein CheW [Pelovirga sp.]
MTQMLPFVIGSETYALELVDIQEIVENRNIYPFPAAPEQISGAIAFHGRIVPVVNLPLLLGYTADNLCPRLIVLANKYGPFALAVDRIRPLLGTEKGFIKDDDSALQQPYVRGVFAWREEVISLLDLKYVEAAIETACMN